MTPRALAALHKRCFTVPRPFTAAEFHEFLASDLCFVVKNHHGFALGRVVADEAELLTIAVDPTHRHAGHGRSLLTDFQDTARQRGARRTFLEVSADNIAAIGLYTSARFIESGRRVGYYRHPDGSRIDAIILEKPLTGD